jgi:hypothetical protein
VGAMLCNSGVEVTNGDQIRFTTTKHAWDSEMDKTVYHGDRKVGIIEEMIGDDIGLVKSTVKFSNQLLDIPVTARTLMPASEIEPDVYFVMDSAFTGKQMLRCFGVKVGKRRAEKTWDGPKEDWESVVIKQGVFSMDEKRIPPWDKYLTIQRGVCGTPIIYAGEVPQGDENAISEGRVGGFMLYTDVIRTFPEARMLYHFCQTTDELIDAGWRITTVEEGEGFGER